MWDKGNYGGVDGKNYLTKVDLKVVKKTMKGINTKCVEILMQELDIRQVDQIPQSNLYLILLMCYWVLCACFVATVRAKNCLRLMYF